MQSICVLVFVAFGGLLVDASCGLLMFSVFGMLFFASFNKLTFVLCSSVQNWECPQRVVM